MDYYNGLENIENITELVSILLSSNSSVKDSLLTCIWFIHAEKLGITEIQKASCILMGGDELAGVIYQLQQKQLCHIEFNAPQIPEILK